MKRKIPPLFTHLKEKKINKGVISISLDRWRFNQRGSPEREKKKEKERNCRHDSNSTF